MAGVETSKITTQSSTDLTIQPDAGGQTVVKSIAANNPGTTPVATAADGTLKKLVITELTEKANPADDDWLILHDSTTGQSKKVLLGSISSGIAQPPFADIPTSGNWVDKDSVLAVQAGGNGSPTGGMNNAVIFGLDGGAKNQSDKNVTAPQRVELDWDPTKFAALTHNAWISGILYAKSGSSFTQTFNFQALLQPTAGWDLVDLTGQPISTAVTSNLTVPTGMNKDSPVTIDGGTLTSIEVSINGGAYTSSPGMIGPGQPISVKGTTGASYNTGYTALVSIGGLQRTWNVTTGSASGNIATPTLVAPVDNTTGLDGTGGVTLTSSAFSSSLTGTHASSIWEIYSAATDIGKPPATPGAGYTQVLSSEIAGAALSYDYTTSLAADTYFYGRVQHKDSDGAVSAFSDWNQWDTLQPDLGNVTLYEDDWGSSGYFAAYNPTTGEFHVLGNGPYGNMCYGGAHYNDSLGVPTAGKAGYFSSGEQPARSGAAAVPYVTQSVGDIWLALGRWSQQAGIARDHALNLKYEDPYTSTGNKWRSFGDDAVAGVGGGSPKWNSFTGDPFEGQLIGSLADGSAMTGYCYAARGGFAHDPPRVDSGVNAGIGDLARVKGAWVEKANNYHFFHDSNYNGWTISEDRKESCFYKAGTWETGYDVKTEALPEETIHNAFTTDYSDNFYCIGISGKVYKASSSDVWTSMTWSQMGQMPSDYVPLSMCITCGHILIRAKKNGAAGWIAWTADGTTWDDNQYKTGGSHDNKIIAGSPTMFVLPDNPYNFVGKID